MARAPAAILEHESTLKRETLYEDTGVKWLSAWGSNDTEATVPALDCSLLDFY